MLNTHLTYPETFMPRRHRAPWGIQGPLFDGAADGSGEGQGGNGGGEGGKGGEGKGDGGGQPKMLTLSEEEFEKRIIGRVKQAESGWKKANDGQALTTEERAELETARKEREDAKRRSLEEKGKYQEALKSQEESIRKPYEEEKKTLGGKIDGLTTRLRTEIVTNKLLAAAASGNAYNAQQVVRLTEGSIRLDDEFNPTVVDEAGQPRFVAGKPMTPEQLVEEFLRENPNHVKAPAGMSGGGATGGASKSGEGLSQIAKLEKEVADLEEQYRNTRSVSVLSEHRKKAAELKKLKTAA